ncbi:hypothetical protein NDU88_003556 [Pleurodeles waltl]|uniref:Uncharacterized protein n=1 Tax=Pleurodeles waltl TaxID=8319 RepID=A0AAV7RGJ9_PLEWA|nr:hypothetical protein NDU88_003556 [Pleurodeles waltl]
MGHKETAAKMQSKIFHPARFIRTSADPAVAAIWNGGSAENKGKEKIFHPARFIRTSADPAVAAMWNGGSAEKKGKEKVSADSGA